MRGKTISRQRRWQIRMRDAGLCVLCGKKVWRDGAKLCMPHHDSQLEYQRTRYARLKGLTCGPEKSYKRA